MHVVDQFSSKGLTMAISHDDGVSTCFQVCSAERDKSPGFACTGEQGQRGLFGGLNCRNLDFHFDSQAGGITCICMCLCIA